MKNDDLEREELEAVDARLAETASQNALIRKEVEHLHISTSRLESERDTLLERIVILESRWAA